MSHKFYGNHYQLEPEYLESLCTGFINLEIFQKTLKQKPNHLPFCNLYNFCEHLFTKYERTRLNKEVEVCIYDEEITRILTVSKK